jgi:hypothetical protein
MRIYSIRQERRGRWQGRKLEGEEELTGCMERDAEG